jgi:hypothetical protein
VLPAEAPRARGHPLEPSGPLRPALLATVCTLALAAAGCGGEGSEPETSTAMVAEADLRVVIDADGDGGAAPRTADVACAAGDRSVACAAAAELTPADFAPASPTQACTEIFGGPDVARVTGTLDGREVAATFTRANGCEIDRFSALEPLLRALFGGYEPGQALGP